MKSPFALAALLMLANAQPVLADPAAATSTPSATAAKFSLDTPIEALIADARAKAVIDTDLPDLTKHPQYEQFKSMSLTTLSSFAPDKLTPERLGKVKDDLAKIN